MNKALTTALVMGGLLSSHQSIYAAESSEHSTSADKSTIAQASKNKPNVIWILLDDVGFGASSTFGGLVETPNLDALAAQGLKYTNFHTTGISSPTRAAILTGRNHHHVGMGLFPETAVDLPGYNANISPSNGTVAEVFRENGYSTFALGKWHLTPVEQATPAGPFNQWPTGKGFEHYYGFLYGETDQWQPQLVEENRRVNTETGGKHLNELLTDKAINYIDNVKSVNPDKPFFLYFAPGATHAPHQVSQTWINQYKGKFDVGWDAYREQVFANQKRLGIIPKNTELPARNQNIKAWDTLNADQKRLYARYFETYAGFLSYTDSEIGRLVDHLKETGEFDNTVIAVVIGDNGASKEGTEAGTTNGLAAILSPSKGIAKELQNIDKIGSEYTSPNYPLGWAQAANAPFKYWKQDANAEGGTRNPLILSYPNGIQDKGGIRNQYSHVIDLLPTTLDLAKIKPPKVIAGANQNPFDGTSLAYSINNANVPSAHKVQYYEINGTRAIYQDGWKAATLHKIGVPFDKDVWELYNLNNDPTEINDLAGKNPAKLKELQALFQSEGKRNNVFPLKDTLFKDFTGNHSAFKGQSKVVLYPGIDQIFALSAPAVNNLPFTLTADVDIPQNGAEGVLVANGGRFGGSSVFVQNSKLHYVQTDGTQVSEVVSNKTIDAGKSKLTVEFKPQSASIANIRLLLNGQAIGEGQVPLQAGVAYFAYDEGFDVGRDLQTPVSESYKVPYAFTGKLEKVTIEYSK